MTTTAGLKFLARPRRGRQVSGRRPSGRGVAGAQPEGVAGERGGLFQGPHARYSPGRAAECIGGRANCSRIRCRSTPPLLVLQHGVSDHYASKYAVSNLEALTFCRPTSFCRTKPSPCFHASQARCTRSVPPWLGTREISARRGGGEHAQPNADEAERARRVRSTALRTLSAASNPCASSYTVTGSSERIG